MDGTAAVEAVGVMAKVLIVEPRRIFFLPRMLWRKSGFIPCKHNVIGFSHAADDNPHRLVI
jgi:hypothetical protein